MVDPKSISQQVHAGFHIIIPGIPNFPSLAAFIFLGTLTVDSLVPGWHDNGFFDIEKILNGLGRHVGAHHVWTHEEKFVNCLLHATVIAPLRNEKDGIEMKHTRLRCLFDIMKNNLQFCLCLWMPFTYLFAMGIVLR